jgi:hypothetical protein
MDRFDIPKIIFCTISFFAVLWLSFIFGLYSGANKTVVYDAVTSLNDFIEKSFNLVFKEASTLSKIHPAHYLQPVRYDGAGVTVNDFGDSEEELILLSGFFNDSNELRLMQRDGTIVNRWIVSFKKIFPNKSHFRFYPSTEWNVDIHGSIILEDGSVVFNFENYGLVKLKKNGDVCWTLSRYNHHSIERAEDGGFWVPARRFFSEDSVSPYPPFNPPFSEDYIMKVSEDGAIISEISVAELLYKNSLESILTLTGSQRPITMPVYHYDPKDKELFHLNDIEELYSAIADNFPLFETGDLAISLRNRNLIIVFNPVTMKIKWWKIGPWVRQHDIDFQPDGTVTIFNNNTDGTPDGKLLGGSNIVKINPATGDYKIIFGAESWQVMYTNIRGKHQILPGNRLLITEHEGGRVIETDMNGLIIWEYINRYDEDEVAEITEARIYPNSYFHASE